MSKKSKKIRKESTTNKGGRRKPKAIEHFQYLSLLGKSANNGHRRRALVDYANKDEIQAIRECIMNLLAGNVPLSTAQVKKLKRHKNAMRILAHSKTPFYHQKNYLRQSGGFLSSIIPIAVSALAPLIGGLLGKR